MTLALRTAAILIALAAILDPGFAVRRPQPPQIDVRTDAATAPDAEAVRIRQRILDMAGSTAADSLAEPSAVVLVAPSLAALDDLPGGVPVSIVAPAPPAGDVIRIVRVTPPPVVLPGQTAVLIVEVEASGLDGQTSIVALEQHGMELARASVQWMRGKNRQVAALAYAPPGAGVHRVRIVAHPGEPAADRTGDAADVALIAQSRRLRVTTFEPRPSWGVTFVRRALEADPVFTTSAFARPSREIAVRAGAPPRRLTATALEPFDAVIVGAPDALSASEVDALDTFIRRRGGAVVLLPDRRPSGAYVRLLPAGRFDEMLVEVPLPLEGSPSRGLKASELALPQGLGPGASVILSARLRGRVNPVIVSWPLGAGRLVFSGALDAWRYRADDEAAFAKFWSGLVANLAAAAPRALDVSAHPALAQPGERVTVRAAIRQTEWTEEDADLALPPIGALLVAADGTQQPIRLWPAAEAGVFEGTVSPRETGRFDVRMSAGVMTADTPLVIADEVRHAPTVDDDRFRLIARATGGVAVSASDLGALERHLRTLPQPDTTVTTRPMRSGWWMIAFAGVLCAEWATRRRRGLR